MKRKRTIFAIAGVGVIALVGATFAVSQNSTILNNIFGVGTFETTFHEEFESPSNWATCETIDKEFTITNNSNVPAAVRVSLEEQWIAADGTTILPLVSSASNLQMAQINLNDNSGWEKKTGGYYYYDVNLGANESTQTLLTGVTLNCDANLDTDADGAYAGATYHLKIKGEAIQADRIAAWGHIGDCDTNDLYDHVACETKGLDTNIDFSKKASVATGNGNGVNTFAAKANEQYPVYYYRGEIDNNNVIWANKCWMIVRTTSTGGVKMIYEGLPVTDNDAADRQCPQRPNGISVDEDGVVVNRFVFNSSANSPADVGYMFGDRVTRKTLSSTGQLYFSNDVRRDGDTYYLDNTSRRLSWIRDYDTILTGYRYFCTNGLTSCSNGDIGYAVARDMGSSLFYDYIYYLPIGGYENIDDLVESMFANVNDSATKTAIELWFEQQNLDGHITGSYNYEDDLEDTIFCNDRSVAYGALGGKDSSFSSVYYYTDFSASVRNSFNTGNTVIQPSLDCPNKNDSFTKNDTSRGNGKLRHKIGPPDADEMTLAGAGKEGYYSSNYLKNIEALTPSPGRYIFTAIGGSGASLYHLETNGSNIYLWSRRPDWSSQIYPMVSLKAGTTFVNNGADGTKEHPYVIE